VSTIRRRVRAHRLGSHWGLEMLDGEGRWVPAPIGDVLRLIATGGSNNAAA
jgi:hypothetical protein